MRLVFLALMATACGGQVIPPLQTGTTDGCGTEDFDGDGLMDACDACPLDADNDIDGDGVCGENDVCPGDDVLDSDDDGVADGCDDCPFDPLDDEDGDTICGDEDQCPGFDDLADADGDGAADACDICPDGDDGVDTDGDGAPDDCDFCPDDPLDDCGVGTPVSLAPLTGTPTQDGISVWSDRGYRFVASTSFGMAGATWFCNPPAGSNLTLTVYDGISGAQLAQSAPMLMAGGEDWHELPLLYGFTAGQTYLVAFHSDQPNGLTFDRQDSGGMGYDIPPWMASLANCSSPFQSGSTPAYPDNCSNTWPGLMELLVVP